VVISYWVSDALYDIDPIISTHIDIGVDIIDTIDYIYKILKIIY